jgi:SAM-dependent methyltransferase
MIKEDFDQYAESYDDDLAKGLSVVGEEKEYFARERVNWLAKFFDGEKIKYPASILDYGCGDGGSSPFLAEKFSPRHLTGVDISAESIKIAAGKNKNIPFAEFKTLQSFVPVEEFDLVFCNGVFHHIPPDERLGALEYIYKGLKTGGYFAFWENNPWNPGTRYVMSRIPFDRDAIMLFPAETMKLFRQVGFIIERKDFLFIFPSFLQKLRILEPMLARFPFGGQYMILGKKG